MSSPFAGIFLTIFCSFQKISVCDNFGQIFSPKFLLCRHSHEILGQKLAILDIYKLTELRYNNRARWVCLLCLHGGSPPSAKCQAYDTNAPRGDPSAVLFLCLPLREAFLFLKKIIIYNDIFRKALEIAKSLCYNSILYNFIRKE